jgi:hypothetical protein
MELLKKIHFKGWINVEQDATTLTPRESASQSMSYIASTLNSAWILMNSATDVWPEGLGSSSGELGHNIMDHHFRCGANGQVEGYEDKYYYGRRPNGIYIPRFRNVNGDKRDYIRGFGYQGSAGRSGWSRDIAEMNIGGNFKDALSEPGRWGMGIGAWGEILPYHENPDSPRRRPCGEGNEKEKYIKT